MVVVWHGESDADLESFRRVRLAVVPQERALTVAEMRASSGPETVRLLASSAGEVVGSGLVDRSDLRGGAVIVARVVPEFRRRGAGRAIVAEMLAYAAKLDPDFLVTHATDEGSREFALRLGFTEVDRQVEPAPRHRRPGSRRERADRGAPRVARPGRGGGAETRDPGLGGGA